MGKKVTHTKLLHKEPVLAVKINHIVSLDPSNNEPNIHPDWSKPFPKKDKVKFLGIDGSYKFTGICLRGVEKAYTGVISPCSFAKTTKSSKVQNNLKDKLSKLLTPSHIFNLYADFYTKFFDLHKPEVVCIEGMAAQYRSNRYVLYGSRAALTMCLRKYIQKSKHKITVYFIEPTSLKYIATENGKASKEEMIATASLLYNTSFDLAIRDDDQADALLLASCGYNRSKLDIVPTDYF